MDLISGDGLAGGGGWTIAAKQAGLRPAWAIEYNAAIAEVHARNLPGQVIVSRIQDVDPRKLERANIATFSPVCTEFSPANAAGEEGEEEISQAEAICRILRYQRPDAVLIENVMAYRKSRSVDILRCCLAELGYWWDENIVNSADYGVPQTRKRFILRARLGGALPPLPSPVKAWRGWYNAIEDLIPTLPESKFAKWQLKRLPEQLETVLIDGRNTRTSLNKPPTVRAAENPCFTVTAGDGSERHRAFLAEVPPSQLEMSFLCPVNGEHSGVVGAADPCFSLTAHHNQAQIRAFLVDGQNAGRSSGKVGLYQDDRPSHTITSQMKGLPRALLVDGVNSGPLARPNPREAHQPAMAITTTQAPRAVLVGDQYGSPNTEAERSLCLRSADQPSMTVMASDKSAKVRAWLEQGRVVSMTPRALARFQTIPDWYDFTGTTVSLACRIIGNAVPPVMARLLIEGMMDAIS